MSYKQGYRIFKSRLNKGISERYTSIFKDERTNMTYITKLKVIRFSYTLHMFIHRHIGLKYRTKRL